MIDLLLGLFLCSVAPLRFVCWRVCLLVCFIVCCGRLFVYGGLRVRVWDCSFGWWRFRMYVVDVFRFVGLSGLFVCSPVRCEQHAAKPLRN